jgi:hypothetical protein
MKSMNLQLLSLTTDERTQANRKIKRASWRELPRPKTEWLEISSRRHLRLKPTTELVRHLGGLAAERK